MRIKQVCFFDYIIISEAQKCQRRLQIYVSAPLCPRVIVSLCPYAVDLEYYCFIVTLTGIIIAFIKIF